MSESEEEEEITTNKKPRRQYVRCSNSILCIFCNQYHQKKREGKCNSFQKELPLFTNYIRNNDTSDIIKEKLDTPIATEVSLRRIMAYMHEQRDHFRLWSTNTNFELGPESSANTSRVVSVLNSSNCGNNESQTQMTIPQPRLEEEEVSYVLTGEHKGPAPRLLSYDYLKNLNEIHFPLKP
jgi:hypothetical protein